MSFENCTYNKHRLKGRSLWRVEIGTGFFSDRGMFSFRIFRATACGSVGSGALWRAVPLGARTRRGRRWRRGWHRHASTTATPTAVGWRRRRPTSAVLWATARRSTAARRWSWPPSKSSSGTRTRPARRTGRPSSRQRTPAPTGTESLAPAGPRPCHRPAAGSPCCALRPWFTKKTSIERCYVTPQRYVSYIR